VRHIADPVELGPGCCLLAAGSCAKLNGAPASNGPDAGGGTDARGSAKPPGDDAVDALLPAGDVMSGRFEVGCAMPISCTPSGGRYCGVIGDGCVGQQDCGTCQGTDVCDNHQCVAGAGCVPLACSAGGARYCGSIGDGCGRSLSCGDCPASQACTAGVCTAGGNCVPLTCNPPSGRYCGKIGDGCGGSLDCGTCAGGGTCGGGGVANVCAPANCTPVSCTPDNGHYCGAIGDGCGGALDCGACPDGMTCGGSGTPGLCPGATSVNACQGLECKVPVCTGATKTTISGTIYDPAGKTPLYNATVYIPNATLDAVPEGVSCDKCSVTLSGKPIATALSDTNGHFTLTNVPAGTNIPLVIQVGKWRRQATVANVNPCADNPITDVNMTRLPRSQSEGHLPKIALTTGGSDALECFLRKIGIADSEFTLPTGAGRVNLYVGGDVPNAKGEGAASFTPALGGGAFPSATTLWSDLNKLMTYDLLVMSCEGSQYADVKKPYVGNIKQYADAGGRLFNDHLHFYWLRNGVAPWPTTAAYIGAGDVPPSPVTATVDGTFPKAMALTDWLVNVGASTTRGEIQLWGAQHSVTTVVAPTQRWIYLPVNANDQTTPKRTATEYLTFNTPVEATPENQCGRVVLTDIHVKSVDPSTNGKDDSDPSKPFPSACQSTTLSPQEKALEFLFFDLSACVQPDTNMPMQPVVPPPGVPMTPPASIAPPPSVPPPSPPPPPPPIP
jgi:hypothetical protein